MDVVLKCQDDGSGVWTLIHPDLGTLYVLTIEPEEYEGVFSLSLWCSRNETILEEDTLEVTN